MFSAYSKVMLTGHNFSVACTSNKSKVYTDYVEDAQLEEISMFFGNSTPIKVCGSADEPKEDTKTCTLVISNATLGSSGYYSCMAMNSMRCTTATIFVKVEGICINNKQHCSQIQFFLTMKMTSGFRNVSHGHQQQFLLELPSPR